MQLTRLVGSCLCVWCFPPLPWAAVMLLCCLSCFCASALCAAFFLLLLVWFVLEYYIARPRL